MLLVAPAFLAIVVVVGRAGRRSRRRRERRCARRGSAAVNDGAVAHRCHRVDGLALRGGHEDPVALPEGRQVGEGTAVSVAAPHHDAVARLPQARRPGHVTRALARLCCGHAFDDDALESDRANLEHADRRSELGGFRRCGHPGQALGLVRGVRYLSPVGGQQLVLVARGQQRAELVHDETNTCDRDRAPQGDQRSGAAFHSRSRWGDLAATGYGQIPFARERGAEGGHQDDPDQRDGDAATAQRSRRDERRDGREAVDLRRRGARPGRGCSRRARYTVQRTGRAAQKNWGPSTHRRPRPSPTRLLSRLRPGA